MNSALKAGFGSFTGFLSGKVIQLGDGITFCKSFDLRIRFCVQPKILIFLSSTAYLSKVTFPEYL